MADEILTILQKTRRLFNNPKKWTQGVFARDKKGSTIFTGPAGDWNSPEAYSFCIRGGIHHVAKSKISGHGYFPPRIPAEDWLQDFVPNKRELASYNNTHSYEEMMDVLDKAIAVRKEIVQYN